MSYKCLLETCHFLLLIFLRNLVTNFSLKVLNCIFAIFEVYLCTDTCKLICSGNPRVALKTIRQRNLLPRPKYVRGNARKKVLTNIRSYTSTRHGVAHGRN